jgi:hypothetical protein
MDFYDLMYTNILTLGKCSIYDIPDNIEEIQKEIISILKKNNLSLSQSACTFNAVIKKLGNTPINDL